VPVGEKKCQCGCGQPASIAPTTNRKLGHVKGEPMDYKIGHRPKPERQRPLNSNGWRLCTGCGRKLRANLKNFYPSKEARDGLGSRCRECRSRENHERYWANVEESRQRAREAYHRRKETQPHVFRTYTANRKARKQGAAGGVTSEFIELLWEAQLGSCQYCGVGLGNNFQVEHRTPLSRGGSNEQENLCLACETCNKQKGSKTEDEYVEWLLRVKGVLVRLLRP